MLSQSTGRNSAAFPTRRDERTFLEVQVGQPFQEGLVELVWLGFVATVPTRRNERTFLEIQVGQPFQEGLVGLDSGVAWHLYSPKQETFLEIQVS